MDSNSPNFLAQLRDRFAGLTKQQVAISGLAVAATFWAYAPSLVRMSHQWSSNPQYSHGYLVPLFAAALLYMRAESVDFKTFRMEQWGIAVIAAGLGLKLFAGYYYLEWIGDVSLLVVLPGLCLLVGGLPALRWSWPALFFLVFMLPLPYSLEVALRDPLRQIGTLLGTYLMQTLGLPAFAEGNVIVVGETRIGIAEACSGLRMLMIFFALSAAVAILSERPLWERAIVVLAAFPIAIICNVLRITVTGVLHVELADATLFGMSGHDLAQHVFHDWAGWMMMPMALVLLWALLAILDRLFIVETDHPVSVGYLAGQE